MADSVRKGRHPWRDPAAHQKTIDASRDKHRMGESHHAARLTAPQVMEMRALRRDGLTFKAIAERFGAKWQTIYSAITGDTWSHLES
jgi:hypothetical protein